MGMQGFRLGTSETSSTARGDWLVLAEGLEHARTGYFIARHEIAKRRSDGLWMWPVHVLEKDWVVADEFAAAFRLALGIYGIAADEMLAPSFHEHELRFADAGDDVPVPRGRVPKTGTGSVRRKRNAPSSAPAKRRGTNEAAKTRINAQ